MHPSEHLVLQKWVDTLHTVKSPTHEQVPFQECICKSNLFVKFNKISLGTQLAQSAM